jgi:ribosomal subunit interface protein
MEVLIHGKQISVGDALREHVTNKLEEIDQKYFNHATTATVTFAKEGHGHGLFRAHISYLVAKNIMIVTEAEENDPYLAFDTAAEKAAKRLRRYKKKLRDHHQRVQKTPESENSKARDYVLAMNGHDGAAEQDNDDLPQGDDPVIVAEIMADIETLSVSEAVMRMDLSNAPALFFRNASHDGFNMIYRRPDGNVGWIDPVGNETKKAARK